jgi:hypothetical protein
LIRNNIARIEEKLFAEIDEVVVDKRNGLMIAFILRCFAKSLFRMY